MANLPRSDNAPPDDHPSNDALPRAVQEEIHRCPLPVILLHVPSERILGASRSAERLLSPDGDPVIDRGLEEFAADEPTGALELFQVGKLDGYETHRLLHRHPRPLPITVWLRAVDRGKHRSFALAFLLPEPSGTAQSLPRPHGVTSHTVIGSTDAHLIVDRISAGVTAALNHHPSQVVGQSLFQLVSAADATALLRVLAQSSSSGLGTSITVDVQLFGSPAHKCQLLILPLFPVPSCAFALLDAELPTHSLNSPLGMRQSLWLSQESLHSATASRLASEESLPGLDRLSTREREIVTRLVSGDRVPTIAKSLFLSPSTVRNHLSAVFRKLRVHSQQELIHLLRERDEPSTRA